ncbi:MAG: hypothetical protein AAFY31_12850 [Pseudomonadota bacterium]
MRLFKRHTDDLASLLDGEEIKTIKNTVADTDVRGWSVFDADGVGLASEDVSETVTAVCSNAIDLAAKIGRELNETDVKASITFVKGAREMHVSCLMNANMVVLSDHTSGGRKETSHVR